MYGGELAAQALAAANQSIPDDRLPHSLHCVYLSAGDPAHPLEHDVELIRDGRSFSSRSVRVSNAGKLVLTASASYHLPGVGVDHQRQMPAVAPPLELPDIADAPGTSWMPWAITDPDLEMRAVVPADPAEPLGRRQFWIRIGHSEPERPLDQAVLAAYGSDFTMISSIRLPHESPTEKSFLMTTLNLSLYFHRSYQPSEWNLFDHWSPVAAVGRGLSIGHVYTADGQLALTAVQEGLIRPITSS
ncbi:hypothetical protein A5653_01940 [Mycobacterium colombiense]|nr:hypothetical protein A5653_01940 [Mycobacterium colombiense]